ncbi:unnamed protein product [Darwinula stevensoni]|uniref:Ig-like domain-containing protein n=1 Tax=Darwinula stevensoni TaxID=69355 RepID=A0A7R8XH77_9CRUS|nr:unnamed protein product [Darwinula stevensoni]CAG0892277.1 unnamed protein product [Darwinula stevensoni]
MQGSKGSQELALTPEGDQARFVGDTFFVSCSSQDPDLRVQGISWTHNGMLVSTDITQPVHVEMRGDGEAADILFQGVRNGDDGDYTCSGVLGGKRVQDSFALTVHNPVSFEDTPTVQAAVAGADFTLECRVKGEPPPVVTWKHQHVG